MTTSRYRALPSIDRLLADPRIAALVHSLGRDQALDAARAVLESARRSIAAGEDAPQPDALVAAVLRAAEKASRPSLRPVINATGVIIHTNLGRAPLCESAMAAMAEVARGYSNLEFDLEQGERGSRHAHIESLLTRLTGAEAALVVNNNASAVLLGLSAVARGKEVVVSRGQAVEIGGGFRIPDVLLQSGARLVEVGTTNRTYLRDYDNAISHETAALLRVHSSNFRVIGFTQSVGVEEMGRLARQRTVLLLDDLGSGALLDTTQFGLPPEPRVQESVAAGADLVFFSGDKLLGGPQAGIVVGRREPVERLKQHPLARAVRIDKLSLAALAATLQHYLRGDALDNVPVWRMIAARPGDLEQRARDWLAHLDGLGELGIARSMIGGGSLPEAGLDSPVLALPDRQLPAGLTLMEVATRLRAGTPAVAGRIEHDRLLLDPRTVLPQEDHDLIAALRRALSLQEDS